MSELVREGLEYGVATVVVLIMFAILVMMFRYQAKERKEQREERAEWRKAATDQQAQLVRVTKESTTAFEKNSSAIKLHSAIIQDLKQLIITFPR